MFLFLICAQAHSDAALLPRPRSFAYPAACWRLFEETLEVLRAAVGPKNVPLPPEHPNWLWSK